MLNDPQAAQYALLVMYAEDMYDSLADKRTLAPTPDPRLSVNWNVVGFITAVDALADAQALGIGTRFFYGFLANSKTDSTKYIAVVRGTANASEWIEDIEFVPQSAPARMAGTVENGFFSIYNSMLYTPLGSLTGQPVVTGICTAVGGNQLTVLGHSLGSSLATYLTLDLALAQKLTALSACLFASPHTGDAAFVNFFDSKLGNNYKVYNYSHDVVPKVPFMFGYATVPKALEFTPQDANAVIQNTLGGNHHAVCYAAMIDYKAAIWSAMPLLDKDCADCILGPNPPLAAT